MMSELFDEQAQREQYEIAHDKEIMEQGIAADEAKMSVSEFEALTGVRKA